MDYAMHRSKPARNLAGLAVIGLHIGIVLALMYGLARPHLERLPAPFEAVIVTPLPPRPPERVPTPELPVKQNIVVLPDQLPLPVPPVSETSITPTPPDTPARDLAGPVNVAPPGPPVTATNSVGVACPNSQAIRSNMRYPAQARRDGLQGDVVARFVVGANGSIRNMEIISSSNRAFNTAVMGALQQFQCVAQGQDVTVEVPFSFRLE